VVTLGHCGYRRSLRTLETAIGDRGIQGSTAREAAGRILDAVDRHQAREDLEVALANYGFIRWTQAEATALAEAMEDPHMQPTAACEHEYGTTGGTIYCTRCDTEWDLLELMATNPAPRVRGGGQ